jgi:hypothetical protein
MGNTVGMECVDFALERKILVDPGFRVVEIEFGGK